MTVVLEAWELAAIARAARAAGQTTSGWLRALAVAALEGVVR